MARATWPDLTGPAAWRLTGPPRELRWGLAQSEIIPEGGSKGHCTTLAGRAIKPNITIDDAQPGGRGYADGTAVWFNFTSRVGRWTAG